MHVHHIDIHVPQKVKVSALRQIRRAIGLAHSRVVRVMRQYCHLVYFGGVFIEGHGVYSYAGGALLIFAVVGMVVGEEDAE